MKKLLELVVMIIVTTSFSRGQATSVNGGSIQGTITDPSGAVVPGAAIKITGLDTGSIKSLTTDSAGFYAVGPLNPGSYSIGITAPGFQGLSVTTVVRTGTVTPGSFKISLGQLVRRSR